MQEKKKNSGLLRIAVVWLFVMLLTVPVIYSSISSEISEKVTDTELVLESIASKIEYSINSRLLNLRTLEVLTQHDDGMLCDFEEHAARIFEADPCVRCIQLAPNGVITHIYPLEGNESAFGNLFVNSLRKEKARHARDSGEMTMGGPYELHQGGVGMVARRPIYMKTDAGQSFFWGFAIEVLDLPTLLDAAGLGTLADGGYSYHLWHYAPQTGEPTVFAGDEELPDSPLTTEIAVPGSTWYLSLVPSDGWFSSQLRLSALSVFFAFNLLTLLLAFLYVKLAGSRDRLRLAADTDPLTGLGNSRSFYNLVNSLKNEGIPFFIYYLDLNKFKEVNDTYGHDVGNELLSSFAQRIRTTTTTTTTTTLFRIGGDEFTIIKHGTDRTDAEKYRQELSDATNLPFSLNGLVLPIASSIGCASYPADSDDVEKVIRLAESHMYEEKARATQQVTLNSRKAFHNALAAMIDEALAQDPDQNFYFYHIDYRNFKLFNYIYGVEAGNELIKRSVSYINDLPECLLCSRGHADQIFFVTKEPAFMSQDEVIRRFREYYDGFIGKLQKKFPEVYLSCNCGVSRVVDNNIETAAGCANLGRTRAKQSFAVDPVFVDGQYAALLMEEKIVESNVLFAAKQGAIHYELQPIMSASEEKMVLAEALGRLRDRNNEIILPEVFIPILTKTGDIVQIDLHILNAVCRDIRARLDAGKPVVPISVNLSPLHFDDSQTAEKIRGMMETYHVPPELICLEITEDLEILDIQKTLRFCQEMHDMGVRIFLDDFGTGYMNIETPIRLPVDVLKIGRSLISSKACDLSKRNTILTNVFSIAADLRITVICEGVETEEQRQWLGELGATYLQGFYYAQPANPESIYKKFL